MKNPKYKVVLYENGKRLKTFAGFRVYPEALEYYNNKIKSNKTFFPKEINWLGRELDYEIAILGKKGRKLTKVQNDMGISIPIEMSPEAQFFIKDIHPYYIEEKFKYWNKNEMFTFKDLIKRTLMRTSTTKIVYNFNNKVLIVDDDTDDHHIFIVKCQSDAVRLVDTMRHFCIANNTTNVLFFYHNFEVTEMFDKLVKKLGIRRTELHKVTTH